MNVGKILGVLLIFLGAASGIVTYGVTGAAIGINGVSGFLWIIPCIIAIIGITILLTSMDKDTKDEKIESVQVFSEKEDY